ncbi:hypothetical protein Tco_1556876 [Tanacetum coccineum]
MSNLNTNLQTQSSNALHNAIMEAGSKDYPPIELIHHCLQNPPYTYQWAEKTVPVAEGSSETTTERYMENYKNVSQDIRDQLNAEVKGVQIILTGIDNNIYSTVDACPNACEMWKAIERLKQGESINVQDLETNLYWEFGKFTSRDGESLESYYSRFYKMMNELVRNQCHVTNHQVNVQFLLQLQLEWKRFVTLVKQSQKLKTVSYHKLYDILKQHQNEVNEIRAERLARTANPLALVAQQQPVYHHQNHPTQNTQYSSTRSQQSTRNRGKAIVTSSAPTYDPEPTTVTEDEEMSKEKEIDKLIMALFSLSFKKIYKPTNNNLITSSNTSRENQDNTLRINRGTGYDNQRVVNVAGARENITPCVFKSLTTSINVAFDLITDAIELSKFGIIRTQGSPRADDHELLEPPYMLEDPYAEAALQAPPSPDYVPGPEEPEQAPPSPDDVPESDHEADPEEDGDEDPEEDPIDYSADGGDDGDDEMDIEEDESADMDIDEEDEDDEMDDEEAEEEHSAPAYPVVVALPATVPSAEETEPFETDESAATPPPHPAYRMTARISIPEPLPVPTWSDSEIPFPLSPPSPVLTAPPPSPIRSLGYRSATIRMRAEAAATSHSLPLPPPFILSPTRPDAPPPLPTSAPTSFPPLSLPTDSHREGGPEGQRQLLAGRVNMFFEIGLTHAHTRQLMETEAGMSREAWRRAMDSSDLAHRSGRQRVMSELLETDRRRREEMRELRAADRTRQQQIVQTLTAVQTLQREMVPLQGLVATLQGQVTDLQGQVMTLQGQVTTLQGQQGPAGGPAQPELPEEAGSSS